MEELKFNQHGQWDLVKAKVDEGLSPKAKRISREERSKTTDKLQEKESASASSSSTTFMGEAHWRKPKSGEDPHVHDKDTAEDIQDMGGKKAAPRAGKAHMPATGGSQKGVQIREEAHTKKPENRKPLPQGGKPKQGVMRQKPKPTKTLAESISEVKTEIDKPEKKKILH